MTHGHWDFTVCSCSSLPVLLPGVPSALICSTTAEVSGEPVMRSALVKARRRIASCAHCGAGCSHAPRPGRLPVASTITAHSPFPVDTATTRSSPTANSRFRHPTHVRTGPSLRRCVEAEVSRWITVESTVLAAGENHRRCWAEETGSSAAARAGIVAAASFRGRARGWRRGRAGRPVAPASHPECRSASR